MLGLLKRGIVLFWALWSTLVLGSNLGDLLVRAGILPDGFAFASGNSGAIEQVVSIYSMPAAIALALFLSVLAWDGVNAGLFWRSALHGESWRARSYDRVNVAFTVSLALWASMMVADEFFLSFTVGPFEGTHRSIFTAMLVSLIAIHTLPDD